MITFLQIAPGRFQHVISLSLSLSLLLPMDLRTVNNIMCLHPIRYLQGYLLILYQEAEGGWACDNGDLQFPSLLLRM